ncbi:MAG: hypothetical protein IPH49_04830 [Ignavibacteria bacterium]|nr:hypothetical protein [Ignavibacteria bacterium]
MRIGIIGAGAWGTALASVAAENGHSIQLWARRRKWYTLLRPPGLMRRSCPVRSWLTQ